MQHSDESVSEGALAPRQPRHSHLEAVAQGGAEVAFAALPLFGPAIQVAFSTAVNTAAAGHLDQWLHDLAVEIDRIAARLARSPDDVLEDPLFYEAIVRGVRGAQATKSQDKLDAFKAVIGNSGSWSPHPSPVQEVCLKLVEDLTPEHIAFLRAIADPVSWLRMHPELGEPEVLTVLDIVPTIVRHENSDAADWLAELFIEQLYRQKLLSSALGVAFQIKVGAKATAPITPLGTALLQMLEGREHDQGDRIETARP